MQGNSVHTLRYFSSRKEIWRWYWRTWAHGLWRYHVFIGLLVATFQGEVRGLSNFRPITFLITALAVVLACMLFFSLWPQIRFKRAERTLSVSPGGWTTKIGSLTGTRSWSEVREIIEEPGTICIVGTNRNALIIPARAFEGEDARRHFSADIRQWHQSANGGRA
jgi:hypothetical protein